MYSIVDKSIAVIKPKQPFLDWINATNLDQDEIIPITLDAMRIDCNSYLLPEVDSIEDGIAYIDEKFEDIFRLELTSWIMEEDLWPQEITLKLFWEWFDVEVFPMLLDIESNDIETIEMPDEETNTAD